MAFAHEQVCRVTGLEGEAAALGGAVTVALCGHWEHEGPCRWPHHTETSADADAWVSTVRFDASLEEVESVRSAIVQALTAGSLVGPDGQRTTWGPDLAGGAPQFG